MVLLDEPHGNSYYGGTISAPVGSDILEEILPYLDKQWEYISNTHKEIIDELVETKKLSDDLRATLKSVLDEFATLSKE